jgi:Rps23 Pro-64 3,4-dihydroxylase Tpa1-like proline 4-hydroxylase
MTIDYKIINKCDFPVLKINNFITKTDLKLIKKEIIKLACNAEQKLENDSFDVPLVKFDRVFLDDYYKNDRTQSNILNIVSKYMFSREMVDLCSSIKDGSFKHIKNSTRHESQLTFYGDKHIYEWHNDINHGRLINWILYVDIDSNFTGGENQISNDEIEKNTYNIDISTKPKDNMLIMMPSWVTHRVAPVFCKSKDKLKGRITVNGHIGYR